MFLEGEDFESIDSEKIMKKQLQEINKEQEKQDLYKFRLSASPFIPKKAIGGKFGGLEHTVNKKQLDQPKSCFSGYAPSDDHLTGEVNQSKQFDQAFDNAIKQAYQREGVSEILKQIFDNAD